MSAMSTKKRNGGFELLSLRSLNSLNFSKPPCLKTRPASRGTGAWWRQGVSDAKSFVAAAPQPWRCLPGCRWLRPHRRRPRQRLQRMLRVRPSSVTRRGCRPVLRAETGREDGRDTRICRRRGRESRRVPALRLGILTRSLRWDQNQYLDTLKRIGLEILALTSYRHK